MTESAGDRWAAGDAYDAYMGRWSRLLARDFLAWLAADPGRHWLEVGCGTGALTASLCARCEPASVVACDPSAAFVQYARRSVSDARVSCVAAGADALPSRPHGFDVIVSGLVLNFIPDPVAALRTMRERLAPQGVVAAYVWDYAGGLEFLDHFWKQAVASDPDAAPLDESQRFQTWRLPHLTSLFAAAGLADITSTTLSIPTPFATFDDYWQPFLGGTGPAPSYLASRTPPQREALAARLKSHLPTAPDGSLQLNARAFAVRAR